MSSHVRLRQASARAFLTACLIATAGMKFASPHSPAIAVSELTYYTFAIVELGAAGLLWTRLARPVLWLTALGLGGAGLYRIIYPVTGSCGCFGLARLTPSLHLLVIGSMGLAAVYGLGTEANRASEDCPLEGDSSAV